MSNPLTDRPPVVDLDEYLTADIGAIRWLRGDERLYIIGERNRRTIPKARPVAEPHEDPSMLPTVRPRGTVTFVKSTVFSDQYRSREEVAASLAPITTPYQPHPRPTA